MPPSRPHTSPKSVSAHLLVILTVPVVLSFFWISDTYARDPRKTHTTVPRSGVDHPGPPRILHFPIQGPLSKGFSFSHRDGRDSVLVQPVTRGTPISGTKPFSFSLGDTPVQGLFEKRVETSTEIRKPTLFPGNGDEKAIVVIRKQPWEPSSEHLVKLVSPKTTVAGGAMYRTGGDDSSGGLMMDFVLPARLGKSSSVFFESRAEYRDSFSGLPTWADRRFDLDLGIGWRSLWDGKVMLGANTFWDASRMEGDWYTSPGFGFEFGWAMPAGIWDVTLNVYRGGGIDLQGGFTFPIVQDHLDMRLYAEKYRFFDGEFILGSKGGVEISSPGRLVDVSYEYGQDSRNPHYHAVSCSLTVPFSLEKLFHGKNPFDLPELPRSQAGQYAHRLESGGVKRTWSSPGSVVEARHTPQGKRWTTPGRLADTIWKPTKSSPDRTETAERKCDGCKRCECCSSHCCGAYSGPEETEKDRSLGDLLFDLMLTGAYLTGDYAYRSAFGPFELEPYEVDRIRREMPNIHRRR